MAAPATAYYRNATKGVALVQKTDGLETETVILPVVFTTAYPDSETMRELFYLDYVREVVREKIGGVEYIGYICGVQENLGAKAKMRPANFISGLVRREGISPSVWSDMYILTDPLNIYGLVTHIDMGWCDLDYCGLSGNIDGKSTFYAGGTFGIEIYSAVTDDWYRVSNHIKTIANNVDDEIEPSEIFWFQHPIFASEPEAAMSQITYRFFHENDVGVFYTPEKRATLGATEEYFKYHPTFASMAFAEPSHNTQVYLGKKSIVGSRFYTQSHGNVLNEFGDEDFPPRAPYGYYVLGTTWYRWFSGMPITSGTCAPGQYPDGDPANPTLYNKWDFLHFEPDTVGHNQFFGCSNVVTAPNDVAIYESKANNEFYTTAAMTTHVPDGWYYFYNGAIAGYSYYSISGGVMTGVNDC